MTNIDFISICVVIAAVSVVCVFGFQACKHIRHMWKITSAPADEKEQVMEFCKLINDFAPNSDPMSELRKSLVFDIAVIICTVFGAYWFCNI